MNVSEVRDMLDSARINFVEQVASINAEVSILSFASTGLGALLGIGGAIQTADNNDDIDLSSQEREMIDDVVTAITSSKSDIDGMLD